MRLLRFDSSGAVSVLVNLAVTAVRVEGPGTAPEPAFPSTFVVGFADKFLVRSHFVFPPPEGSEAPLEIDG